MALSLDFETLWENYGKLLVKFPDKKPCTQAYDNQCAIRMTIVLSESGLKLASYTDPVCKHGHARGAEGLANWLWKKQRPKIHPDPKTGKEKLGASTGIIFFKDCFTRDGQTARAGDHIDLWKAGDTKTFGDDDNHATQIWFWPIS